MSANLAVPVQGDPHAVAGSADLDPTRIELFLENLPVVIRGGCHPDCRAEGGQRVVARPEMLVRMDPDRGSAATLPRTTDLPHADVSSNADTRS